MTPLEPNGLYDQLRSAYKECLVKGWLGAADLLKKEFTKIQNEFLSKTINKEKQDAKDIEDPTGC